VHLTVRTLGSDGTRLDPRKADLEVWRQRFAQALRDRGVEAEASPRRARGVSHKAERTPVRKIRERHWVRGMHAPLALMSADRADAAKSETAAPWESRQRRRQWVILRALAAEAVALSRSDRPEDRGLGFALMKHVREFSNDRRSEESSRTTGKRQPEQKDR